MIVALAAVADGPVRRPTCARRRRRPGSSLRGYRHAPYYAALVDGGLRPHPEPRAIFMTAAGATSSAVRNDDIPEGDLRVRLHAGGRSLELARHLLLSPRAQHREELILTVERLAWAPHLRNVPFQPAGQL